MKWKECLMHDGEYRSIEDLAKHGIIELHVVGSGREGWRLQAADAATGGWSSRITISPIFHKDCGETRSDLMEACRRAYGVSPRVVRNSYFGPI